MLFNQELTAAALFLAAGVSLASAAPEITVVEGSRSLSLALTAEDVQTGSIRGNSLFRNVDGPIFGPWTADLSRSLEPEQGSSSQGLAIQSSNLSTFFLDGEGAVEARAADGPSGTTASGSAGADFNYTIVLAEDTAFSVTAEAAFDVEPGSVVSLNIFIFGTEPDGSFLFETAGFSSDDEGAQSPFLLFTAAECKGGTELTIAITAGSTAEGNSSCRMDFDFEANFGDADKDGLLDVWETDGIDIDDDGVPEVVLNNADPMKKDIFIELDAMTGVPVDMTAIQKVIESFAQAPGSMVNNPDGSDGITLHVEIDETNLPASTLTGFGDLDTLKAQYWGLEIDRTDPNAEAIKAARDKAYRYCLWGGRLVNSSGSNIAGRGELPGNDFIVAATTAAAMTNDPTRGLAGTFMHELGHTLGLRHGGQDNVNHKPNYLSVMNYSYAAPWRGVERAFRLDFARNTLSPLNEAELVEPDGLDGPANKIAIYNSAPAGQSPIRTLVVGNVADIDWDRDGDKEDTVAQDVSYLRASSDPSPGEVLYSYSDWDRLWYNLSGNSNFDDSVPRPGDAFAVEMTEEDIESFSSTQVVDLTGSDCVPDINTKNVNPGEPGYGEPDGEVDGADLSYYVENWLGMNLAVADINTKNVNPGEAGYGQPDGEVDGADLSYFVENWLAGCP